MMTNIYYLIAVVIFLCGSAFFSAAEMAISSANRLRLENAAEEGNAQARRAVAVADHYEDALSAILIGNNLCNIGSDSLATLLCVNLFGEKFTPLSTALMTLIVIFFCESAPKIVAKKNATRYAMAFSLFLRSLMVIFKPVIALVGFLIHVLTLPFHGETKESGDEVAAAEFESILETVEDEGVIDEDRSEMLRSALDFTETPVMDVMTARVDVVALDIEDDREKLLDAVYSLPVSRAPVYEGSIDNVIGVLYTNKVFRALLDQREEEIDFRSLLLPVCYFYKTTPLSDALSVFRRQQQHLAIVTDEYGGTLGIVTLEDVMEELVGDIWDENDEVAPSIVEREEGGWELDGDLSVTELPELLDVAETALDTESATVGGWTIETFGSFPVVGDSFRWRDWVVTVLEMGEDGRRVEKITIVPTETGEN